jgi:hypothetical protein
VNLLHYSVQPHSLAEDVKLSAHGRHPTAYPAISLCVYFFFLLLLSVFCFLGTSVLAFKFGGDCFESARLRTVSPSPR